MPPRLVSSIVAVARILMGVTLHRRSAPIYLLAAERGEAPWLTPAFEQYWMRASAESFALPAAVIHR